MAGESDRRIRQLFELAARDRASGRIQDEARNLRQAAAEAPNHPLVLNEAAKQRLVAGDAAGAHQLLQQAVKDEPLNPSLWLNLAAASQRLRRTDEEMAALQKVLSLEPRNIHALLRMAALHEIEGDSRTAAATYRTALEAIPARAEVPPELRPLLQTAKAALDSNNLALETFLEERFKDLRARYAGEPLGRFDKSLATVLLKRRVYRPQPSFMYFPHLPAFEFYERGDFPWLDSIEAATEDIRGELMDVLAEDSARLQPYMNYNVLAGTLEDKWRELNASPRWSAYFFWREGVPFAGNIARCPRTIAALEAWPRCDLPSSAPTAMFSILDAKTRIPPHTGVSNCRLVVHVPLVVPPHCGFRVGAETRDWTPGEAFVFDDTIEHEAWNDSNERRAVLILDIWNPYLSLAEREMVRALTAGVAEFYGDLPDYIRPPQKPN